MGNAVTCGGYDLFADMIRGTEIGEDDLFADLRGDDIDDCDTWDFELPPEEEFDTNVEGANSEKNLVPWR